MGNPKSTSSLRPKPELQNGFSNPDIPKPNRVILARKCELDDYLGRALPIPTQIVSNEEYYPLGQSRQQQAVEYHINDMATQNAKKLGMDRRRFLRTSCGMATAFAAMNHVFGPFFKVGAAELLEPAAAGEKHRYFVFDVQTHHVDPAGPPQFLSDLLGFRNIGSAWNPELKKNKPRLEDLFLENFIKEIFLDSETDLAMISGVPTALDVNGKMEDEDNILTPERMVKTRALINQLANSQRMVSHGLFAPDLGTINLESMQAQVEGLKIEAWKGYTGAGLGPTQKGWWLDDEKQAYPTFELSRKLKIKNVCIHKGLPFGYFNEEHCHPKDVVKASKDFPDLNFIMYHSGFKWIPEHLPAAENNFEKNSYVPWVSDLCEYRKKNPHMTNVYMELGTTFGSTVITHPLLCTHVLGMIIDAFGADHVLWGTDSIWWGTPQWQIEALRRLQMPEMLMKRFGYKPLTHEVKSQIFGLNGARVYGIDPETKRNPISTDYVDRLRKIYDQAGGSTPSNTQYGWVRA